MTTEMQRLRDRIAELECLLGGDDHERLVWMRMGIEPTPARLLGLLLRRPLVSHESAHAFLYGDRNDSNQPDFKIINIYIHKLRKCLKPLGFTIENVRGEGYAIPAGDRAYLRELVDQARDRECDHSAPEPRASRASASVLPSPRTQRTD